MHSQQVPWVTQTPQLSNKQEHHADQRREPDAWGAFNRRASRQARAAEGARARPCQAAAGQDRRLRLLRGVHRQNGPGVDLSASHRMAVNIHRQGNCAGLVAPATPKRQENRQWQDPL